MVIIILEHNLRELLCGVQLVSAVFNYTLGKSELIVFLTIHKPAIQDSNKYINPKGRLLCFVTAAL